MKSPSPMTTKKSRKPRLPMNRNGFTFTQGGSLLSGIDNLLPAITITQLPQTVSVPPVTKPNVQAASPQVAAPAAVDDKSVFELLTGMASQLGRPDLVEEFKRRAVAAPVKSNPTPESARPLPPLVADGLRLLQEGKIEEAITQLEEASKRFPEEHFAFGNLGVAYARLKRFAEAERCFRESARLRPDGAGMYGNIGAACLDQKKIPEAEVAFRKAIELDPTRADFHRHLGNILDSQGKLSEAVVCHQESAKLDPTDAEGHSRLGRLLMKANRLPEAEAGFREAVRLRPDNVCHWKHLGSALEGQAKSAEAESAYRTALTINPKDPESLNNLGASLASQEKLKEAEEYYRQALELAPQMAMVHNNLGHNLRMQDRFDEAEAALKEAIRLQPKYAEARNNLGIVYIQQRRVEEGLAAYEEALQLRPDYPEAHLNRSLCWLTSGKFAEGWKEYEWRFRLRNKEYKTPVPRWDGSPLNGRTLLLQSEQGLGDTAQFIRYASMIPRGSGGSVIFDCPEPLVELARTCKGIDRVIPRGQPIMGADIVVPLLSLPGLLGTDLNSIPSVVGYFSADPTRVAFWQKIVDEIPGRKVGISWQGSKDHKGDRARSVKLAQFRAMSEIPGITLCSIQKGYGTEQLTDGSAEGMEVIDFGTQTKPTYGDAAALLKSLDLLVTVDTSLAHVAGALGVPVWVMVPFAPDWRWMHDREDTPWYPTMRLFRQNERGEWGSVFKRVESALHQWPERLRLLPQQV